ncbi:NAD(P)/FAD-dependent oxidoreductase [Frigidibacter sp. ROC022]|uniref:NAD(P)/FAD-dependent oxidoreductase n=1 Tax=Frigidibacter sp. ROC022 TaxID=2971796 RepID=UPI00215B5156|nr:FAD-binding oxidoreductase [Frigidibacter sp. ROC022]MCR8722891.1 FAD-binding oxidoreductase [Frigidibacter sp. ROC022]
MSDILVIGGGVAGLSAAAFLSETAKVTVIEAETGLGYHTSGRSAALYEESYGAPSVTALNRAAKGYLFDGGYLSTRGLMLVGTRDNADQFDHDMVSMGLDPLDRDEMLAQIPILNPEVVTRGGWHEAAWDIDTDRLLQDFARTVRAAGGAVRTGLRVSSIRRDGAEWRVTAGEEEFSAPLLVNAAGSWADGIARMAGVAPLGLQPYRRSMARIPAPGGHDVSGWPMMFGPGEEWYAKPDAGALLVSPAEEHPMDPHDAFADDMVLAEGLARYEAVVTTPVNRLLTSWAGLRTFAPDRTLVLGPDPAAPGFVWSAGQGGYGFQTSAAAGRLVADLVGGRPSELDPEIVAALSPARFR